MICILVLLQPTSLPTHHHQTEFFSSLLSTSEHGVHQRVHLRHVDDSPHEPAAEDRRAEQQMLQSVEGEHTVGAKGGGEERRLNRMSKKKKINADVRVEGTLNFCFEKK